MGDSCQIVGDDLLVTNPTRVQKAIDDKACNALLNGTSLFLLRFADGFWSLVGTFLFLSITSMVFMHA